MKDPKEISHQAAKIAETLPEKYQEAAFKELLRYALSDIPNHIDSPTTEKRAIESPSDTPDWVKNIYSNLPEAYLVASGTRKQQAAWAVIKLHQKGKRATSENVRSTIKKHLGISPESLSNTSGRLGELTPKCLSREDDEESGGYHYLPSRYILELFENLE